MATITRMLIEPTQYALQQTQAQVQTQPVQVQTRPVQAFNVPISGTHTKAISLQGFFKRGATNKINSTDYKYVNINDSIEDYEDVLTEAQAKKINTAVTRINDKLPRIEWLDDNSFGPKGWDKHHNKVEANAKLQRNENERRQILEYIDKQIAVIKSVFKQIEDAENDKNTLVMSQLIEKAATKTIVPNVEDLDIPDPEEDEPQTRGTEPHHRTPQVPAHETTDVPITTTVPNNTTNETNDKNDQEDQSKDKRKKIIMYAGIGVGVMILSIVIFKLMKRKK